MQHPSIDAMLLTDDERNIARSQMEEIAYYKWLDAGCPNTNPLVFWCEAELEWIEYFYIPDRYECSHENPDHSLGV